MDCGSEPYGGRDYSKIQNLLLWGVQHKIRKGISPTSVQCTQHSAIKFHVTLNFESWESCDIKVLPTKILHYARFWNNADPQNKVLSRSALFQNWWENEWKVLSSCYTMVLFGHVNKCGLSLEVQVWLTRHLQKSYKSYHFWTVWPPGMVWVEQGIQWKECYFGVIRICG